MKAVVNAVAPPPVSYSYPCLKRGGSTGAIYLFHTKASATVLYVGDCGYTPAGAYITNLNGEDRFYVPFHGTVTLSNDNT